MKSESLNYSVEWGYFFNLGRNAIFKMYCHKGIRSQHKIRTLIRKESCALMVFYMMHVFLICQNNYRLLNRKVLNSFYSVQSAVLDNRDK